MQLEAMLLLGPTGSGKTPLGDWLELNSLHGRRCHHFDFGANLRAVAGRGGESGLHSPAEGFTPDEIAFLRRVLEEGALLEKKDLHLALRILDGFVARRNASSDDLLILNGLPRHIDQAKALDARLTVIRVVELECSAAVIAERLRLNSGGDRGGRRDDIGALVRRKLAVYEERTHPLLEFYGGRGVAVTRVEVGVTTRPGDIRL